ncbi:MAG: TonB-dependent receptor [Sphingobium sp.]
MTDTLRLLAGCALTPFILAPAGHAADRDDIIVTGQVEDKAYLGIESAAALGITASILDTPFSIRSVTGELLRDQQAASLWEGIRNISGVASRGTNSDANEDFVIRGFELDPRRNFYRDGRRFYNQFPVDPHNLERIEVLKGPASILYGHLEPGGIINLVTPKMTDTHTASIRLSAGSFDQYKANAAISGPIAEDVYYRVYGSVTDADSYRNFVEHKRQYINPSIGWNITPSTSLRFNLEWQHDDRTADTGIVAILDRPADVPYDTFYGEPGYKTETLDNVSGSVTLTHAWAPNFRQTSSVGYYDTKWDRDQVSVEAMRGGIVGLPGGPGFPGEANTLLPRQIYDNKIGYSEWNSQHDFALDIGTGALSHKLLFGLSVYRYESNERLGDRVGTPDDPGSRLIDIYDPEASYGLVIPATFKPFRNSNRTEKNFGIYLQDMIELGERWIFLVGARYDSVKYVEHIQQGVQTRRLARKNSGFSPRAGVVFKADETLSLYSSLTRAFSPRNGNRIINEPADPLTPITTDNIEPVDPEKSNQIEIGAKWNSADQRFFVTLALYDLKRRDVVQSNPRYTNYSVQIGQQRSRGVELDVSARFTESVRLIGSYSYIDAEIRRDAARPQWVGHQLSSVARHSGSVWLRYDGRQGFGAGAGVFYTGKRQGNLDNDFQLPAYTRVDASLSWKMERVRFDVALKNLLDERYYLNAWRRDRIMPGSPRSVVGSVSFDW